MALAASLILTGTACAQPTAIEQVAVINEVWDIVENEFYDPHLHGLDGPAIRAEYQERARHVPPESLPQLVNEMLDRLHTSHTAYLTRHDPRHFQLLGIFEHLVPDVDDPRLVYEGIGVEIVRYDDRDFVQCVYDGMPAKEAGIRYGDEIVTVDGQSWNGLRAFQGKQNQNVTVRVRRYKESEPFEIPVQVRSLNGRTMFHDALRASLQKFDVDDTTIGYMHLWSYAGTQYHDFVRQQLLWGDLKDCDAVILDLRDGWGGASLEYLNLFREPLAQTSSHSRDGSTLTYDGVWSRPVVLLVNERSTSGKELYAYAFKKHGFGKVVGTRTAGAVMAGSPRLLESGAVLYLAIRDVRVDGQRLEGAGIEPTVRVPRPLPYAAGADQQLDAALKTAVHMVQAEN